MTADGAGCGAGRVDQHAVEAVAGRHRASRRHRRRAIARSAKAAPDSRAAALGPGDRSIAVTSAPACASCAVLPPGAAQRSMTRRPATSPNSRAGSAAAASCTHHCPSENPGSIVTGPCSEVRTVPVGKASPCSRVAQCAASALMVRSSEGSWSMRVRQSLARWFRRSAPHQRANSHGGISSVLRMDFIDQRLAFAGAAAQHRVDESGIFRRAAVGLHQPY